MGSCKRHPEMFFSTEKEISPNLSLVNISLNPYVAVRLVSRRSDHKRITNFKKVSKKEDLIQQKKVLNNIFDIYSDALLNKIKE